MAIRNESHHRYDEQIKPSLRSLPIHGIERIIVTIPIDLVGAWLLDAALHNIHLLIYVLLSCVHRW